MQSGLVNATEDITGVQLGAVNLADDDVKGVQVGVVNRAEELKGVQSGLVNIANDATGVQSGLVNLVLEADRVVQVGGICVIASNPWYAKAFPLFNYGGSYEKREIKKKRKAEALKKEREQLEKDKIGVRV